MQQLERLAGIALHGAVIEQHLRALGFGAEWVEDGVLQLWPPSWRHDVTMEADVVEELVRLHGYDRVPPMPVRRTEAVGQPALCAGAAAALERPADACRPRPRRSGHLVVRRAGVGGALRRRSDAAAQPDQRRAFGVAPERSAEPAERGRAQSEPRSGQPRPVRGRAALLRRAAGRTGGLGGGHPGRSDPRAPLGRSAPAGRRVRRPRRRAGRARRVQDQP